MNALADGGFVLLAGPLAGTESGRTRAADRQRRRRGRSTANSPTIPGFNGTARHQESSPGRSSPAQNDATSQTRSRRSTHHSQAPVSRSPKADSASIERCTPLRRDHTDGTMRPARICSRDRCNPHAARTLRMPARCGGTITLGATEPPDKVFRCVEAAGIDLFLAADDGAGVVHVMTVGFHERAGDGCRENRKEADADSMSAMPMIARHGRQEHIAVPDRRKTVASAEAEGVGAGQVVPPSTRD